MERHSIRVYINDDEYEFIYNEEHQAGWERLSEIIYILQESRPKADIRFAAGSYEA